MSNKEGELSINTILENIQMSRDAVSRAFDKITELQFKILDLQKDILQIQKIQEDQAALFSENEHLKQELKHQKVRIYTPPASLFVKTSGGLKRPDDPVFGQTPDQKTESDGQPEPLQEHGIQLQPEHRVRGAGTKPMIGTVKE